MSRVLTAVVAGILWVSLALQAGASRMEFVTMQRGARVAGAEVCFFRAGDGADPIELYLASAEVRCLAADSVLDLPKGRWGFFARHANGIVHMQPIVITERGPHPNVDPYGAITLEMQPAGTLDLDVHLKPDESLALYVSNEGTDARPTLVPIPRAEEQFLVPAGMSLHLLRLRNGQIIDVSEAFRVDAGTRRKAPAFIARDHATVVSWLSFPEEVRVPGDHWARLPAPQVSLVWESKEIRPAIAPRGGFGADGALFVFRGVPAGRWTLRVTGERWTANELTVDVTANAVITARPGLTTRPAGTLQARWTFGSEEPPSQTEDCGIARAASSALVGRLFDCPALNAGIRAADVALNDCRAVADATSIDPVQRTMTWQSVPPGAYLVAIKSGNFPTYRGTVTIAPGEAAAIYPEISAFFVHGRVRMDGKPLRARVDFRTGSAVTNEAGEYVAQLTRSPRDLPIEIVRCSDGKVLATSLPDRVLEANQRHDIDLESTRIEILVEDKETRKIVANAEVQVGVITAPDGDGGTFLGDVAATDENGRTVAENVPRGHRVVICALGEDHERACAQPFEFSSRSHRVTVTIPPKGRLRGRVTGAMIPDHGFVFSVDAKGTVREQTPLTADGTFRFRHEPGPSSYFVIASPLPLMVLPVPPRSGEEWLITAPSVPLRTIQIASTSAIEGQRKLLSLMVGSRLVPAAALWRHQDFRGMPPFLVGAGPLLIRDVLEIAPLSIVIGPVLEELSPPLAPGADLFTDPAWSSRVVRKPVPPDGRIVF